MSKYLLLAMLPLTAFGIGENPMDLQTMAGVITGIGHMLQNQVDTIDVPTSLIMGKWYQVYKAAVNFDMYRNQMYCPIAYFKENRVMGEDGFSIEEAYRVHTKNGPIETYKRDLNKVGTGRYWMYTEEYFYPRQFYIIKAGPNFDNETKIEDAKIEYIVVTDASRMGLMVYARDPMTFYQQYNKEVTDFLEEAGFGGRIFWNSPRPIYQGPDCEWPTEKEVFARRVLKNHENNMRQQNSSEPGPNAFADMLKNPEVILQKLVQMH
uniref:Lipocln_cytosolic_FA-bd_dom domain-containing protein n=2 Tax=Bursaphelenchus xylophilus TaxID=6326 RepID=A0A1I7S9H2_BURXY